MKRIVVSIAVVSLILAVVGVSSAVATSSTASDGVYSVSISAPDSASKGATVTVTETITNLTDSTQSTNAVTTLTYPNGKVVSQSSAVTLAPHESQTVT
jgi:hypothetical protein